MNSEKEFDMIDAFVALKDLDDDTVSTMIKPKTKKLHEGKGYPLYGARQALDAAKEFLNENDEIQLEVIDPDADALEHVKDRIDYVGQMILRCNRCQANRFIDMDALVENPEEKGVYNIDDECPNCKTSGIGYEIIGQVGKYEEEKPEKESDDKADSDADSDAADIEVEADDATEDELKFDNDESSKDDSTDTEELDTADSVEDSEEVTEVDLASDEEAEPDMMETSSNEDEDDDIEDIPEEEDEDTEVKESYYKPALYEDAAKSAEYEQEALMYNKIMEQMANEDVYETYWAPIWDGYESNIKDLSTSDIVELADVFEEVYKKFHNDGLLAAEPDVIKACAAIDKKFGLANIENHHNYTESVEVISNTTISEVLGSLLDADKVGKIEITNKCDNKKDEKVYDGDYNNLPLNLANATCTGFDVNNRTLACNIDQEENHGRRSLADILNKFDDDKSDNIHLYDIASSEEVFKGKKSDAIDKYGKCGFISIDTPAVIRITICDPSIVSNASESDKDAEAALVEHIIAENNLSITRLDAPYSNEFWIRESIREKEDLEIIYEAYVRPLGSELMAEFKKVTGYFDALDEAFEAGYRAAKKDEQVNEGVFGKLFDKNKPASIEKQQEWEDELNGEFGEISDKRRAELEARFAAQRDWERKHAEVPVMSECADAAADNSVDEDFIDAFKKKFDKPYSIKDQERLEAELNGEFGEISDKRRKEIEDIFAYQRDWEARHAASEVDTADIAEEDPVGVAEAFMSRDQMIAELRKMGKNYYFDKYSDAQIYRILDRERARVKKSAASVATEPAGVCEKCGARLNDSGTCPSCDHGEAELNESTDLTLAQIVSDSIHHMISDLGYDSADEEFPDDVLADIENNYNVDIPNDPESYRRWSSAVFDEISKQLSSLAESI